MTMLCTGGDDGRVRIFPVPPRGNGLNPDDPCPELEHDAFCQWQTMDSFVRVEPPVVTAQCTFLAHPHDCIRGVHMCPTDNLLATCGGAKACLWDLASRETFGAEPKPVNLFELEKEYIRNRLNAVQVYDRRQVLAVADKKNTCRAFVKGGS
eukprot:GEMP01016846.1.p1 GENE.GEMP01016846.1~~GEMP01016846.1.p1  ORF type:complete len:152 (+),score=37.91 GEMP01016846.1:243-698(+)